LVIHVVSFAARPGYPGDSVQGTDCELGASDNAIMKDEAAEEFVMGSDTEDGSDAIQVEEDAVEFFASEEGIEVKDEIVEEREAEEEVFEESPGSWWRWRTARPGCGKWRRTRMPFQFGRVAS